MVGAKPGNCFATIAILSLGMALGFPPWSQIREVQVPIPAGSFLVPANQQRDYIGNYFVLSPPSLHTLEKRDTFAEAVDQMNRLNAVSKSGQASTVVALRNLHGPEKRFVAIDYISWCIELVILCVGLTLFWFLKCRK